MTLTAQLKKLWVLERHPKGALALRPMLDVLERNYRRWQDRETEAGWELMGLFPTLESGQEAERRLKRKYAELRKAEEKQETAGDEETNKMESGN